MRRIFNGFNKWEHDVSALAQVADFGIVRLKLNRQGIPAELVDYYSALTDFSDIEDTFDMGEPVGVTDELLIQASRSVSVYNRGADGSENQLGLQQQSDGTLSWLALASRALVALRTGGVLMIDELDASLHPSLVYELVDMFTNEALGLNLHGAQLIFTSHDATLLGNVPLCLLDPNEVWFTEKDDEGASELFSLADFKPHSGSNMQKRYLFGAYGAIPTLATSGLHERIREG